MMRILGIPGSVRAGSWNRRLLEAAVRLVPADVELVPYDGLGTLPLFDEDLERGGDGLHAVRRLHDAVAQADGLLFATPEYNQSLPGVLKNAIDWLSRPVTDDVLAGRPAAIIGATSGPWGTRLAQAELRHVLGVTGCLLLPQPRLYVRDAAAAFDARGALVHEPTRKQLAEVLAAFHDWIHLVTPVTA